MILVTGATGQLGRLVIASLLHKMPAAQIVAAVRNVDKAADLAALGVKVRQANYNSPHSWDAALLGVDKVLLISSSDLGKRVEQHRAVVDAAKRAKVKLLAYTSVLHADTSVLGLAGEHRETEAYIRAAGVPAVILRNGWYTENYTMGIPGALALGSVFGCAGAGKISSAARADYAEAAARVMTLDGQAGKVYELAGDSAYTLSEFAAEIARQTGRAINYVDLPEAGYKKALLDAGLPEGIAQLLADSDAGVAQGTLFDAGKQLSQLIGRPTTAWADTVAEALVPKPVAAYAVGSFSIKNPSAYKAYVPAVIPTIQAHGGEVLVADYQTATLEGQPGTLTVILKFASSEALYGWYESPEYQEIVHLRTDNSDGIFVATSAFDLQKNLGILATF